MLPYSVVRQPDMGAFLQIGKDCLNFGNQTRVDVPIIPVCHVG
jgi:hypothetical protein